METENRSTTWVTVYAGSSEKERDGVSVYLEPTKKTTTTGGCLNNRATRNEPVQKTTTYSRNGERRERGDKLLPVRSSVL